MKEYGIFPFRVLELNSIVLIKEKYQSRNRERFIDASDRYYLWIEHQNNGSWKDELVKDFNSISNKLIK